jgi:hypothetical protein
MNATGSPRPRLGQLTRRQGEQPVPYTATETAMLLVAGVAAVGGLIHATAAIDLFASAPPYARVYSLLAVIQIVWAGMLVQRRSRGLLLFGVAFNDAAIALWIATRTTGLLMAPQPLSSAQVSDVHALFWCGATLGGASGGWQASVAALVQLLSAVVTTTAVLGVVMYDRTALARRITRWIAPALLAVLLMRILYGLGTHAT